LNPRLQVMTDVSPSRTRKLGPEKSLDACEENPLGQYRYDICVIREEFDPKKRTFIIPSVRMLQLIKKLVAVRKRSLSIA
jgi:hypothetical protein